MILATHKSKINDDYWEWIIVDTPTVAEFNDGKESTAVAHIDMKKVYIALPEFNYGVLAHEYFHILWSYLHLDDADLSTAQMEEVVANLWAHHLPKANNKVSRIMKSLKKKLDNRRGI